MTSTSNNDRVDLSIFKVNNLMDLNGALSITKTPAGAVLKIGSRRFLLQA